MIVDAKGTDALAQWFRKIYHPLEMKSFQMLLELQHRIFDPKLAITEVIIASQRMEYIA